MIINRAIRQMSGFIYERRESAGEMNRSQRRGGKKRGGGERVNSAFARHPPTRRAIYRRYNDHRNGARPIAPRYAAV